MSTSKSGERSKDILKSPWTRLSFDAWFQKRRLSGWYSPAILYIRWHGFRFGLASFQNIHAIDSLTCLFSISTFAQPDYNSGGSSKNLAHQPGLFDFVHNRHSDQYRCCQSITFALMRECRKRRRALTRFSGISAPNHDPHKRSYRYLFYRVPPDVGKSHIKPWLFSISTMSISHCKLSIGPPAMNLTKEDWWQWGESVMLVRMVRINSLTLYFCDAKQERLCGGW